ncbi:hypothetical protein STENM327S_01590 [Streptomyces tendae]
MGASMMPGRAVSKNRATPCSWVYSATSRTGRLAGCGWLKPKSVSREVLSMSRAIVCYSPAVELASRSLRYGRPDGNDWVTE